VFLLQLLLHTLYLLRDALLLRLVPRIAIEARTGLFHLSDGLAQFPSL